MFDEPPIDNMFLLSDDSKGRQSESVKKMLYSTRGSESTNCVDESKVFNSEEKCISGIKQDPLDEDFDKKRKINSRPTQDVHNIGKKRQFNRKE